MKKNVHGFHRFSPPHNMDKLPYLTECIVRRSHGKHDVYVQRNVDENDPRWVLMKENIQDEQDKQDKQFVLQKAKLVLLY